MVGAAAKLDAFLACLADVARPADVAGLGPRTVVPVLVPALSGAEPVPEFLAALSGAEPVPEFLAARHPGGDGPSVGQAVAARRPATGRHSATGRRPATARHSAGPGGLTGTGATLPVGPVVGPVVGSGEARDAKPPSVQIP